MQVIILSGFAEEGKCRLIQEIVDRTLDANGEIGIDILLFELRERDMGPLQERDGVMIREMGGGCPCCTLEGDLRKVIKAELGEEGRSLVIEAGGGCDLERMRAIIRRKAPPATSAP